MKTKKLNWKKISLVNQKGMTLMEILIAISLLAVLGTFVVGNLYDTLNEGQADAVKIQMKNFDNLLGQFRRHCNRYPTSEEGLEALVNSSVLSKECKRYAPNGYVKGGEIPKDPWGGEYLYELTGARDYIITSPGQDEEIGTEDDISSKDK